MGRPMPKEIELPLLKEIENMGGKALNWKELPPRVAAYFPQITDADIKEKRPGSSLTEWERRIRRARYQLKKNGWLVSKSGTWTITEKGKERLDRERPSEERPVVVVEAPKATEEDVAAPASLSIEKDLQNYLAKNPQLIEEGLTVSGKEYSIEGVGRLDLLCQDKRGRYVVIETKKGRGAEQIVGQILRYIGGLKREGRKARGIIIVNEQDEKLNLAIEPINDFIAVKYYKVKFEISDSPA